MGTECRSTSYLSLKVSNGVRTYCFSTENPGNCLKRRGGRSTHGIVDTAPSDANLVIGNWTHLTHGVFGGDGVAGYAWCGVF